jgi:hypothetical protein
MDVRTYLQQFLPTQEQIEGYLKKDYYDAYDTIGQGCTYDAELGWILKEVIRHDGVDGSKTFYHYEPSGCRKRMNSPEKEARIHTYGDSFTHSIRYLAGVFGRPLPGTYRKLRHRRVQRL